MSDVPPNTAQPQYSPYVQGVPQPVPEPGTPGMVQPAGQGEWGNVPQPAPGMVQTVAQPNPMPPMPPMPQAPQAPEAPPTNLMQQIGQVATDAAQMAARQAVEDAIVPIRSTVTEIITAVNQLRNWSGDANGRLTAIGTAFDDVYEALVQLQNNDTALRELIVKKLAGNVTESHEHVIERYKLFVATEAAALNVPVQDIVKIRKAMVREEVADEPETVQGVFDVEEGGEGGEG